MFKFFKTTKALKAASGLSTSGFVQIRENLPTLKSKLQEAGVGDIDFNLKCIVAHVIKKKFNTIYNYEHLKLTPNQYEQFERLVQCRIARMPLQYIVGEWDFMNITLKMKPTVFIPRPETEEFVRLLLEKFEPEKSFKFLEVGCGCGAISLAVLKNMQNATSVALERSKVACDLAKENAKMLKLDSRFTVYHHTTTKEALVPDNLETLSFDFVISNPPYVMNKEFALLEPEVKVYENANALLGGPDGLSVARSVCDVAARHLVSEGKLWMELGESHPPLIKTIINTQYKGKLQYLRGYQDQYKRERFVEIAKVANSNDDLDKDRIKFAFSGF